VLDLSSSFPSRADASPYLPCPVFFLPLAFAEKRASFALSVEDLNPAAKNPSRLAWAERGSRGDVAGLIVL